MMHAFIVLFMVLITFVYLLSTRKLITSEALRVLDIFVLAFAGVCIVVSIFFKLFAYLIATVFFLSFGGLLFYFAGRRQN